MARNLVDVRTRIVGAARREFAERGLAGARIDRIATDAGASKERLYAYFGDKTSLFRAVLDLNAVEFSAALPLQPEDVAGFAIGVFDHAERHPDHLRMLTWARLEGIAYRLPGEEGATPARLAALREAQERGLVDPSWRSEELLELLFGIAHAWVHTPFPPDDADGGDLGSRRRAVAEAARRLLGAGPGAQRLE